jgi:hypothetical protein
MTRNSWVCDACGLPARSDRPMRYLYGDRTVLLCPSCMNREIERRAKLQPI